MDSEGFHEEREERRPGDFIQAVPADGPAAEILRNTHRAQPANRRVILVENISPDGNVPKQADRHRDVGLGDGRECRAEEFAALFAVAGNRVEAGSTKGGG